MEAGELLGRRPVMAGPLPAFDVESAPEGPGELFARWLAEAVERQVTEPQVVTLSTADARGRPSSRVLMLRDVDVAGAEWVFASSAVSRKGTELAENPWASLCMYWHEQGRQVRVGGRVTAGTPGENAREFLGRPDAARLAGLTGRQSAPMPGGREEFAGAWREAEELIGRHPEAVPADYTVYTLRAVEVEFWQGDEARRHVRLRYLEDGERGWRRELLWP